MEMLPNLVDGTTGWTCSMCTFHSFPFQISILIKKCEISMQCENKQTSVSQSVQQISSTYPIWAYHIWSCFWWLYYFPSTVINGGVWMLLTLMWGADVSWVSATNSGGRGSVDIWKQIQAGPELFPQPQWWRVFTSPFSEEELEPDIKTHCMSFIVYCI